MLLAYFLGFFSVLAVVFILLKKFNILYYFAIINFALIVIWHTFFNFAPEKMILSTNVTETHSGDISYSKNKLSFLGMSCNDVKVTILENPLSTYSDVVAFAYEKEVTVVNLSKDEKEARLSLFKFLGIACNTQKNYIKLVGLPKANYSLDELNLVKENGIALSCYNRFNVEICWKNVFSKAELKPNQTVISYNKLKTNLDRVIDISDTYEVLENRPIEFYENFIN